MTELNNRDIEKFFYILNKKLVEKNQKAEIIICGGASMALLYDRSIVTKDIDGMIISTDVKMDLLEYVRQIGEEYELNQDWFNEGAKGFLTDLKGNWSEQKQEALKFSNLTVSSVSAEQLLTLKLAAARTDSRDIQDAIKLIDYLGIQNENEALDMLEKNIYKGHLTAQVEYFTRYAFNKITKEAEKGDVKMAENKNKLPEFIQKPIEFEWQGKPFQSYIDGYIAEKLGGIEESVTQYGEKIDFYDRTDLAYKLLEYDLKSGSITYSTYEASEFLREYWYEAGDTYEYLQEEMGRTDINPFDDAEEFQMVMVQKGIEDTFADSEFLEKMETANDPVIDKQFIDNLKIDLRIGEEETKKKHEEVIVDEITKEAEKGENEMPERIVPTTPMIKTVLTGRLGNVNVAERELENGEKMKVANFKIYATDVNSPSKTVELKEGLGETTRDIPLNCSAWGTQAEYIEELSKKDGLKTITGAATFHYDSKHPEQPRFVMTRIDKENEIARQMNNLIRDYESGKVESFSEGEKTPSVKSNDFDKAETLGKEAEVDKSGEKDKDAKTL